MMNLHKNKSLQNLILKNQKSKERKLLNFKIYLQSNPIKQSPKKHKNISPKKMISKSFRKKAKTFGADSLDYSKRKNYKYVVEYNDKKIHFGSAKTEDYVTHHDLVRREKYLKKAKRITDKDGRLTHELPFYPNYWSVNLLN